MASHDAAVVERCMVYRAYTVYMAYGLCCIVYSVWLKFMVWDEGAGR